MSAGLGTLRDDGVDTPLLKHLRLRHGRGAGDDENPGTLDGVDDLLMRQAKMEAHQLWLVSYQHRDVFGVHFTPHASWHGHSSQALRVVLRLQKRTHRLADIRGNLGFWPDRIVGVKTAAAQLPEASDPPLCVLR